MIATVLQALGWFLAGCVTTSLFAASHDRKHTSPDTTGEAKDERIRDLERRLRDSGESIRHLTARINEMQAAHQITVKRLENDKIYLVESCEREVAAIKDELKAAKNTLAAHGIEPEQTEPKPESTKKAVLRVLADNPGKWYSTRQLSEMTGKTVPNVKGAIARLFPKHILLRRYRGRTRVYTLNPQQPTQPANPQPTK